MRNTNGTWLAIGTTAALTIATAANTWRRGSRATGEIAISHTDERDEAVNKAIRASERAPIRIVYTPSQDEIGAINWIGGRYVISELIEQSWDEERGAYVFDVEAVQRALADDGIDRVPMLAEDTNLAAVIWALGPEERTTTQQDNNGAANRRSRG